MGILSSGRLWATNIRFLNDAQEFALALGIAEDILSDYKQHAANKLELSFVEVLRQSIGFTRSTDVFVTSFSQNADQLSQWRGYCPHGRGYSLGFAARELTKLPAYGDHRFLIRCRYTDEEHRELVLCLVRSLVRFLEECYVPEPDNWQRVLQEAYKLFGTLLALVAPAIKDPSFAEEDEWRLIGRTPAFAEGVLGFRRGGSTLVPYYSYIGPRKADHMHLVDLIVGPTPSKDLAQSAVRELALTSRVHVDHLRTSTIPFRHL